MTKLMRHHFGDIGRRVEEIWKPSHEGGDLNDAYPPHWLGEMAGGIVNCPDYIAELPESISRGSCRCTHDRLSPNILSLASSSWVQQVIQTVMTSSMRATMQTDGIS